MGFALPLVQQAPCASPIYQSDKVLSERERERERERQFIVHYVNHSSRHTRLAYKHSARLKQDAARNLVVRHIYIHFDLLNPAPHRCIRKSE